MDQFSPPNESRVYGTQSRPGRFVKLSFSTKESKHDSLAVQPLRSPVTGLNTPFRPLAKIDKSTEAKTHNTI
jgi:hypothetical protein